MFHRDTALQAKVRWPVADLNDEISNFSLLRVVRLCTEDRFLNLAHRYSGAKLLAHLKAITASLNLSILLTGSQLSSSSNGVMWSYFRAPQMILQAKF